MNLLDIFIKWIMLDKKIYENQTDEVFEFAADLLSKNDF